MPPRRDPGTYSVKKKPKPVVSLAALAAHARPRLRGSTPPSSGAPVPASPSFPAAATATQTKALKKVRRVERQEKRAVQAISAVIRDDPKIAKVKLSSKVSKPTLTQPKKLLVPEKTVRQLLSDSTEKQKRATVDLRRPETPKVPKAKAPPKPPQRPPTRPVKPPKAQRVKKVQRQYKAGRRLLPGLDKTQTKVAATVLKQGLKSGATKKELLAAAETGIVESGFRNLDYGDADSLGWRQERTSQYGTGPATNVKGGAKRFFAESVSDTGGTRGKGQTAGQLAQTIQGSAFPERYDQVEAQAKPIVEAFTRGKVSSVKQKPGEWAGSEKAVLALIPRATRAEGRDDKRTPAENASVGGATASDHLTTNETAYAADIPPDPKVYAQLRKRLGLPSAVSGSDTVSKDGYRYQLIFGAEHGHADHIHLGAEWVGAGLPAGTVAGGTIGSTSSGIATPPGVALPSATPAAKTKRGKAKKQQGRARSKLIRQLIAEGPASTPALPSLSTESFSDYAKRQPISVGL